MLIYEQSPQGYMNLLEAHKIGLKLHCPICHSELIIAVNEEEAELQQVQPGIYCAISLAHIFDRIETRSPYKEFEERLRQEWSDK